MTGTAARAAGPQSRQTQVRKQAHEQAQAAVQAVEAAAPRLLRIGLTGGIGSGKSTVAQALVARGARLVDTDAIARALTARGGAAVPAVAAAFGGDAIGPDGAVDRARLRARVFADPALRRRLEALLHPLIGAQAEREAAAATAALPPPPALVFDVPLLAESRHWRARVDRVLVVDCGADTQVARVAARPGWDAETARRVIAQQADRAARRAVADAVIHNDGIALATLQGEVDALWRAWGLG